MVLLANRLMECLSNGHVEYEVIHHRTDYTARQAAADTDTPSQEFAKSVVLQIDDTLVVAVIPGHFKIDLGKADEVFNARVHLAPEAKVAATFPDCEIGAEPPFGNLYGLPVYVSPELARDQVITFNAGTHTEAIRMRYADFERMVKPQVADLAWHA